MVILSASAYGQPTVIVNDVDESTHVVPPLSLHIFIFMVCYQSVERLNIREPVEESPLNYDTVEEPSLANTGYARTVHVE